MGKPAAEFIRLAKEGLDAQPHEYLLFDITVEVEGEADQGGDPT